MLCTSTLTICCTTAKCNYLCVICTFWFKGKTVHFVVGFWVQHYSYWSVADHFAKLLGRKCLFPFFKQTDKCISVLFCWIVFHTHARMLCPRFIEVLRQICYFYCLLKCRVQYHYNNMWVSSANELNRLDTVCSHFISLPTVEGPASKPLFIL